MSPSRISDVCRFFIYVWFLAHGVQSLSVTVDHGADGFQRLARRQQQAREVASQIASSIEHVGRMDAVNEALWSCLQKTFAAPCKLGRGIDNTSDVERTQKGLDLIAESTLARRAPVLNLQAALRRRHVCLKQLGWQGNETQLSGSNAGPTLELDLLERFEHAFNKSYEASTGSAQIKLVGMEIEASGVRLEALLSARRTLNMAEVSQKSFQVMLQAAADYFELACDAWNRTMCGGSSHSAIAGWQVGSPEFARSIDADVIPLTEAGYQQLALRKSDSEMEVFVRRLLKSDGREIVSSFHSDLLGFLPFYSGTVAVQSLENMRKELLQASWVHLEASVASPYAPKQLTSVLQLGARGRKKDVFSDPSLEDSEDDDSYTATIEEQLDALRKWRRQHGGMRSHSQSVHGTMAQDTAEEAAANSRSPLSKFEENSVDATANLDEDIIEDLPIYEPNTWAPGWRLVIVFGIIVALVVVIFRENYLSRKVSGDLFLPSDFAKAETDTKRPQMRLPFHRGAGLAGGSAASSERRTFRRHCSPRRRPSMFVIHGETDSDPSTEETGAEERRPQGVLLPDSALSSNCDGAESTRRASDGENSLLNAYEALNSELDQPQPLEASLEDAYEALESELDQPQPTETCHKQNNHLSFGGVYEALREDGRHLSTSTSSRQHAV
eukprot:TRINITY_DN67365_c0_g1_i1.p1 TRINITY_DN67365_c0_g1~~TRINITY_DN67365_c0_g1_i1.p1  ORF type:complete len:700 (-),score=101.17 TRINITY_DN67365_c0_g1_i1:104-2113(-)